MATSDVRPSRPSTASRRDSPPETMPPIAREASSASPWIPDKIERGEAPLDVIAREEMIRTAAYLHAECRSFEPGHELEDWFAAEREIDKWIATRAAPHRHGR